MKIAIVELWHGGWTWQKHGRGVVGTTRAATPPPPRLVAKTTPKK